MIKICVMNAQTLTGSAPISFDEIKIGVIKNSGEQLLKMSLILVKLTIHGHW